MSEEHVFDLLPGYALGILDEMETSRVSMHISDCDVCREKLQVYTETGSLLAEAVSKPMPAPDLKDKVINRVSMASLQNEKSKQVKLEPGFTQILANFFRRPAGAALGFLALLAILILSISTFSLWQQVNQLQQQLPAKNMQIVQLTGTTNAPEAAGYVMVFKDEPYGSLAVTHAPQLKAGQQYQIWLIEDGKRTSGGVFSVNSDGYGVLEVVADRALDSFDSFGITVEPEGGSLQPTGEKILGGNL